MIASWCFAKSLPLKKDATVRGKSGLHRAECQLTAGECELMESTTENIPPKVRVKR